MNESFLKACADKAVIVFMAEGIPDSKYPFLLKSMFDDREMIVKGITEEHLKGLKQFGFDLSKMDMDQRRAILFQMSLCRVLSKVNKRVGHFN